LERELGVSPVELAQTHRLLLAKRLLADTDLPVTRIAFASGFQSLRRFNSVFRERYRMPPSALRAARRAPRGLQADPKSDLVRLTLAYRPPLAWNVLVALLERDAVPGVEVVEGRRYGRTFRLGDSTGVVYAEDAGARNTHVNIDVSSSLVPVLMPLLARLRHFLDLDAEPSAVDAHLTQTGLGKLVRQRPGLRIPGALDGFDVALQALLSGRARPGAGASVIARRFARELGEPIDTGIAALDRLAPRAERVADADMARLVALGVPRRRADTIAKVARLVADGTLRLEPGCDVAATQRALAEIAGVGDALATMIVMRALYWPDAFPVADRALQRAAGVSSAHALLARAEPWRPWRAYAAMHLWLSTSLKTVTENRDGKP
jgi:AraC family transcriptional regulator of adaptative response / DNA-3-methyladenine glycosylase II